MLMVFPFSEGIKRCNNLWCSKKLNDLEMACITLVNFLWSSASISAVSVSMSKFLRTHWSTKYDKSVEIDNFPSFEIVKWEPIEINPNIVRGKRMGKTHPVQGYLCFSPIWYCPGTFLWMGWDRFYMRFWSAGQNKFLFKNIFFYKTFYLFVNLFHFQKVSMAMVPLIICLSAFGDIFL